MNRIGGTNWKELKLSNKKMKKYIKCDYCGCNITDKTFPIVDENYNQQKGLVQCEKCFSEGLGVDEETEES